LLDILKKSSPRVVILVDSNGCDEPDSSDTMNNMKLIKIKGCGIIFYTCITLIYTCKYSIFRVIYCATEMCVPR
jgi:hypothetical protein